MSDVIELLKSGEINLEEYQIYQLFHVYPEGKQYLDNKLINCVMEKDAVPHKTTETLWWFEGRQSVIRELYTTVEKVKQKIKQPPKPTLVKPPNPYKRDSITASLKPSTEFGPTTL